MEVKATQFRKNLFEVLDYAVHGGPVEITYKGARLVLSASVKASKLAGAVRRNALLVDPDSIVSSDEGLMSELEHAWGKSDKAI